MFVGAQQVLDCTLGGGGHALALLQAGARVTGVDRDPAAIEQSEQRLRDYAEDGRFRAVRGDFTQLDELQSVRGETFDGILADLGVSSAQIDSDERGFSFRPGVPLDMRMSGEGRTAADLLNTAPVDELSRIFADFGDEPRSRRLAAEVVRRRSTRHFVISDDLVGAIRGTFGAMAGPSDFARLFQALRIAVNEELAGLARVLPVLRDMLEPGGTLAIIAYHSGEDRLVKHAMRSWSVACHCPPRQPICTCGGTAFGSLVTKRSVQADAEETARNTRARSARLRAWRKSP